MLSATMIRFLSDNEIKAVQTTAHAHTVERLIITFKYSLYRRLDSLNDDTTKWITPKYNISLKTYNSTEHSTTQIKPNEAGKMKTTFGLTGIFKMQPNIIEHTLI